MYVCRVNLDKMCTAQEGFFWNQDSSSCEKKPIKSELKFSPLLKLKA